MIILTNSNPALALQYLEMIRKEKGRYLRDQVQAIQKAIEGCNKQLASIVLEKCVQNQYLGAIMFRDLLALQKAESNCPEAPIGKIILLDPSRSRKADIQPEKVI